MVSSAYLSRTHCIKGVSNHHLYLGETQMQARESFITAKTGSLQVCSDWKLLAWVRRGRLNRSGVSCVISLENMFGFLIGLDLETETKNRDAGTHRPSLDQFLADCYRLWVRVLLSYIIRSLSLCVSVSQSPHFITDTFAESWPVQERVDIRIDTLLLEDSLVVSMFNSITKSFWPFTCYIILTIIWVGCANAFKNLDKIQQTSIMTTMKETRIMNSPHKMIQNQELWLPNPGQENKSYMLWRSALENK